MMQLVSGWAYGWVTQANSQAYIKKVGAREVRQPELPGDGMTCLVDFDHVLSRSLRSCLYSSLEISPAA